MKTSKKIKVIQWRTKGYYEPALVYRLDDKTMGKKFFQHLIDNAEVDGREQFRVYEMTQKQWDACEKAGKEKA